MKNILGPVKKRRVWGNILTLALLGLGVYLILPQITVLENSIHTLLSLLLWAVGLAFVTQGLSYLGSGYLLQKMLEISHQAVVLTRSTLIVLGSASVALVAGGSVGSSAAIFRWSGHKNTNVAGATLASLLPSLFTSLMLVLFSIFGLAHLILVHGLTEIQVIGFSITIAFLGLVILGTLLASHFRNQVSRVILGLSLGIAKLLHRPNPQAAVRKGMENIFSAWDELRMGKWHRLMLGAFLNVFFDLLTLYFLFIAAGVQISLGVLLSGYALPLLLGRLAFILPGGVGVVESSMAGLYASLGIPDATAVVVVLAYRLISFWIPSLSGFPIAAYLENTSR
ncbi:conserved hypothetical protein [Longilinea arvoryzae]|uniref:Integral membrane protein n=1 Tax=Longilinea arvoryzae TaxID=360412 RepID=A0A0S7B855_9CHLR|nr:TIGR00374 family protein [Longilinea arvoryzae]GAP13692.1 conserved hypothetical protein [Longilinea arvoryzae]